MTLCIFRRNEFLSLLRQCPYYMYMICWCTCTCTCTCTYMYMSPLFAVSFYNDPIGFSYLIVCPCLQVHVISNVLVRHRLVYYVTLAIHSRAARWTARWRCRCGRSSSTPTDRCCAAVSGTLPSTPCTAGWSLPTRPTSPAPPSSPAANSDLKIRNQFPNFSRLFHVNQSALSSGSVCVVSYFLAQIWLQVTIHQKARNKVLGWIFAPVDYPLQIVRTALRAPAQNTQ